MDGVRAAVGGTGASQRDSQPVPVDVPQLDVAGASITRGQESPALRRLSGIPFTPYTEARSNRTLYTPESLAAKRGARSVVTVAVAPLDRSPLSMPSIW